MIVPRPARVPVPLRRRPLDVLIIAFFCVNLFFITYVVDLEQLVIADPGDFRYPLWPPPPAVDLVHWWGNGYDPLLMARPAFWRMTIWIDVLLFGPFYAAALVAFVRGRDWIRVPAIFWAGLMTANVLIILMEERFGVHRTSEFPVVLAANLPWLLLPLVVLVRLAGTAHPFTRPEDGTDPGRSGEQPRERSEA